MDVALHLGDCLDILPTLESESVDAIITDPPYPCIKRDYGYWTVDEWWALMRPVVAETRRILKPTGSAVFILQPNSERVGQMRGWLWEFMAWVCRDWNMVQDVWWWNYTAPPVGEGIHRDRGLLKASIRACVWMGACDCFRAQSKVLIPPSRHSKIVEKATRRGNMLLASPSGMTVNRKRMERIVKERGGVVPFNLLAFSNSDGATGAGSHGHGAGTPLKLADWWTRYICPPGGTVADWFMGSGTMGVAAVQNGCNFIGIEKEPGPGYFETAQKRIAEALAQPRQAEMKLPA